MALGVYKVPREFKDEDKWFRFFTKTQLFIMLIGLAISVVFFLIFGAIHATKLAVILSVFVLLVCALLAFFKIPESRYLYGGGYPAYQILLRIIRKYFVEKKQIYIKNIRQEEDK